MAIGSIKWLKSRYRELRRTFGEKWLQDCVGQGAGSKEGLIDRENQHTNATDDLDSASITQSDTTSPDPNNATSSNLHDSTHLDGITGHSTHEVEAAVQRTRRKIHDLDANINETDAAGPNTNITAKPDNPIINSEAPSTTSGIPETKPYPKEHWPSQLKHLQTSKHVGWEQFPGRHGEKESVPRDSKMEFGSPGEQPNTESRRTSSNIFHYIPPITSQDYSSCFNENNKPQNTRRRLFEIKLSYLKMEFPEYAPMFTHPAFCEGFDDDTEPSPDARTLDVKTINLTAQVVNLTIKTGQFNSNGTDLPLSNFSRPISHQSFKRPRSFNQSTSPIPSYGDRSSVKIGRASQSSGADILASANQPKTNGGNGCSQAETLVSEVTEEDLSEFRENTEAQAAVSEAPENVHTINADQRRVFAQ